MLLWIILALTAVGVYLAEQSGGLGQLTQTASNVLQQGVSLVTGNLSASQIAQYASCAGFTGDDLVTAIAVALAESSGNPYAQGDYGDPIAGQYNAFGLWQINIGENPSMAGDDLTDPQINANDAYKLFRQGGWRLWSTYNSGAYTANVNVAQGAVNG